MLGSGTLEMEKGRQTGAGPVTSLANIVYDGLR